MKTAKFFNACVDAVAVEAQGDGPMKKLIEKMGGWFVTGNMTPLSSMSIMQRIGKVKSELLVGAFVQVTVSIDPHDSSKHIMRVSFSNLITRSKPSLSGNHSNRSLPSPRLHTVPCSPDHYPLKLLVCFSGSPQIQYRDGN